MLQSEAGSARPENSIVIDHRSAFSEVQTRWDYVALTNSREAVEKQPHVYKL